MRSDRQLLFRPVSGIPGFIRPPFAPGGLEGESGTCPGGGGGDSKINCRDDGVKRKDQLFIQTGPS